MVGHSGKSMGVCTCPYLVAAHRLGWHLSPAPSPNPGSRGEREEVDSGKVKRSLAFKGLVEQIS